MDFLQHAFNPKKRTIFKPKAQEFQQYNYIYRDELNKKTAPLKVKKKVHFELERDQNEIENQVKSGIQLRVLMTKEEATKMLSKCKDGGILEFKDVASEIVRIPKNRVEIVCSK
ncbi:hypothetical protein CDL12_13585 [Handroanthus impetiginosus]|uniref:DUF7890 domain-containing protein n=1 Tax=Handroanthus impetiginosus TaxID=429701 RepID=A0A2G9H8F0_9LAMI|nr:hypothetical protein CDL12_13585 [Handroanthus impetiginosus]